MSILYPVHQKQKRNFVTSAQLYARFFAREVRLPSRAIFSPFSFLTKYVRSQGNYETKFLFSEIYVDSKNDFCFIPLPGMGAPSVALSLDLGIALGIKKSIFLGTAGSLQDEVEVADMVLCQEALCADGTSPHYTRKEIVRADKKLLRALRAQLRHEKHDFHVGRTWTTDAIFRETYSEIKHYQKKSVLSVDMETAAFLAVCRQQGIPGAAGVVISDVVSKRGWEPSLRGKEVSGKLKVLFDIARKTLLQES